MFDERNRYIIENYPEKPTFSSFLPGIAGPNGIPLWVFYVNRGQAITSFGVENKNHPIMEFQPAAKAYLLTPYTGFRTFLKLRRENDVSIYEPFSPSNYSPLRTMYVGANELEIEEKNTDIGLQTNVLSFTLSGEPFAALARQVTITNTGEEPLEFELLDGMPMLMPYGVDDGGLKNIARTIEAWMEVFHHETNLPFYRLRASAGDTAEVKTIEAGNFAFGFVNSETGEKSLPVVVDPSVVFGSDTSFSIPRQFQTSPVDELMSAHQVTMGKTPCAFFGMNASIAPGESVTLSSVYGQVNGYKNIQNHQARLLSSAYFDQKRGEAGELVDMLTNVVATKTTSPVFDAYTRQTFLDNVLRGGWPVLLGDKSNPVPYHIYSRKHGDPERDYNFFHLAAEYFAQGNGNYRDVNQNRRMDVWLEPGVGAHNIRTFLSLIQIDGYNPLVVQGLTFSLDTEQAKQALEMVSDPERVEPLLRKRFTPGSLLKTMVDWGVTMTVSQEEFLAFVIGNAQPHVEANFGEGFWVDHWTYNLDLVERYLAIFPERKANLLWKTKVPYFQSPATIRPRDRRYVLTPNGPRQYHAVTHGEDGGGWLRVIGDGRMFQSRIIEKLVLLSVIKFSTLDPYGMGVEMEAGKPGWYDALNGLPGMFGSSMPETYELLRLLRFVKDALDENIDGELRLPVEVYYFIEAIRDILQINQDAETPEQCFSRWNTLSERREKYRTDVRNGLSGRTVAYLAKDCADLMDSMIADVERGITRSDSYRVAGVPPTYFSYEMTAYERLNDSDGEGRPYLRAKTFLPHPLPPFLEGPVRRMKVVETLDAAETLHQSVKTSPLYDSVLDMYKVNAALETESHEIGRARAFTPGWLENESIWMHMAYKYLLELLRVGLYSEFWDAAKTGLVPFRNPEEYGRSPLENSSFIASSAHPDTSLHGRGFVARLSGSTAEFLDIWAMAMAGDKPFTLEGDDIVFALRPALPGWLFPEDGHLSFNFLGTIRVEYENPACADTWECVVSRYHIIGHDGAETVVDADAVEGDWVKTIRERKVKQINVSLTKK